MKRALPFLAAATAFATVASIPLLVTFAAKRWKPHPPALQQPLFTQAPGSPFPLDCAPGNIAMGDLNGDRKLDLVLACGQNRQIMVSLGQGDGRFSSSAKSPIQVPDPPNEIVLGDINNDTKLDLAIGSHDSYAVVLLLGDGQGGLAPAPASPFLMKDGPRAHTHGLEMGDFNRDGKLDLVTANNADNDLTLAFGDGRGAFTRSQQPIAVGKAPYPITVGDLNGDNRMDIVATSTMHGNAQSSYALTILIGDGKGGFRRTDATVRSADPWFVAIGDLNRDGKADLVTTHWEKNQLTVLAGDGSGGFTEVTGSPFNLGSSAWGVKLADLDRDRTLDVAAAGGSGLRLMLGDGKGVFKTAAGSPYPAGRGAWRLAIGDINGDGKPDIATSNLESKSFTVLLAR